MQKARAGDACFARSRRMLIQHTLLEVWLARAIVYWCWCPQAASKSLHDAAEALGLRFKTLDKKAEKAQIQALREDLKVQLAAQSDPAAALSLVVPLLVIQVPLVPASELTCTQLTSAISTA